MSRLVSLREKRIRPHDSSSPKAKGRRYASRIAAGTDLLPFEDNRLYWARLMRDTYVALVAHCGGTDEISDTRRMAARRVAALEAELVSLEDRIASIRRRSKEPPTSLLQTYGALADRQRRLSEVLGWDRDAAKAKTVPTLDEYLRSKRKPVTIDA